MPWTIKDVDRFKKGLTSKQKRKWVAIANSILKKTGDEGYAIRAANKLCTEAKAKMAASMIDTFDIGNRYMINVDLPFGIKFKRSKKDVNRRLRKSKKRNTI